MCTYVVLWPDDCYHGYFSHALRVNVQTKGEGSPPQSLLHYTTPPPSSDQSNNGTCADMTSVLVHTCPCVCRSCVLSSRLLPAAAADCCQPAWPSPRACTRLAARIRCHHPASCGALRVQTHPLFLKVGRIGIAAQRVLSRLACRSPLLPGLRLHTLHYQRLA